ECGMSIVQDAQDVARIDKSSVEQVLVPYRHKECLGAREMMTLAHVPCNDPGWSRTRANAGQRKRCLPEPLGRQQTGVRMDHGEAPVVGQTAQDLALFLCRMRQEAQGLIGMCGEDSVVKTLHVCTARDLHPISLLRY